LLCFLTAVSRLDSGQSDEGKARLEEALHQAAAACYAAEGVYPPNLAYLLERYGIQYAEDAYTVLYQPVASNLMPDITVLERTP
jgi:hypothetical protein